MNEYINIKLNNFECILDDETIKEIPLLEELYNNNEEKIIINDADIDIKIMTMIIRHLMNGEKITNNFEKVIKVAGFFGINQIIEHCYEEIIYNMECDEHGIEYEEILKNKYHLLEIIEIMECEPIRYNDLCDVKYPNFRFEELQPILIELLEEGKIELIINYNDDILKKININNENLWIDINMTDMLNVMNIKNIVSNKILEKNILNNLVSLKLHDRNNNITDENLKEMENLEYLHLLYGDEKITDIGIEYLTEIRYLTLLDNINITDIGLIYMCNIEELSSRCNKKITDDGLEYLKKIEYLELNNNNIITDEGLSYVKNLEVLHLNYNTNITDEGLEYLSNIKILYVNYSTKITDEGLEYLKNIMTLNISRNTLITDIGLEYIGETITILHLSYNNEITDEGLEFLSLESYERIKYLDLNANTKITDMCLEHISERGIGELLMYSNPNITECGIDMLDIECVLWKNKN